VNVLRTGILVVGAAMATATIAVATVTPAQAAASSAGKNTNVPTCFTSVHVSDETSPGKVEVFGGWGCAQSHVFTGTILLVIYRNGAEIMRTNTDLKVAYSNSTQIALNDDRSNDRYYGTMTIKGAGPTNFTIRTGTITT
jgi:hypothetical protein